MDGYIGEIRLLPYTFPPYAWFWCNGQTYQIAQYQALYAVIGNTYGGDQSQGTFAVPDLRGRAVVSASLSNGSPPGLTAYTLAQTFGATTVTAPLAAHTHAPKSGSVAGAAPTAAPSATGVVNDTAGNFDFAPAGTVDPVNMAPQAFSNTFNPTLGQTGSGLAAAHTNLQPYLPIYFAICWQGEYPTPS